MSSLFRNLAAGVALFALLPATTAALAAVPARDIAGPPVKDKAARERRRHDAAKHRAMRKPTATAPASAPVK